MKCNHDGTYQFALVSTSSHSGIEECSCFKIFRILHYSTNSNTTQLSLPKRSVNSDSALLII